ncbi:MULTISPECIES: tape measure protein [Pseudocitrobacter]|uniref:tape measure protein n=1 Tax=Pseudocitrobacter TaxID=1504576 RepID=UPI0018F4977D|nr:MULTISPECIES: tape measure protein [Pseudocitrobacter]GHD90737.1 phage tail tape measure protein [Pseudocitrobacter faecalis]
MAGEKNAGSIVYEISADVEPLLQGGKQASASLDGMERSADRANAGFKRVDSSTKSTAKSFIRAADDSSTAAKMMEALGNEIAILEEREKKGARSAVILAAELRAGANATAAQRKEISALTGQLYDMKQAQDKASSSTGFLKTGLSAIASSIALTQAISWGKQFLQVADNVAQLQARIARLSTDAGAARDTFNSLADISSKTGANLSDTTKLWETLTSSLRDAGATNSQILNLTDTLQKIGRIGGSSTEEMANALRQFGQSIASGTIRAEEFNSILEQMPELARQIASGLGVSIGQLRQMMLDGKLTAQDALNAIQDRTAAVNAEFQQLPRSMGQATGALETSMAKLVSSINEATGASSLAVEVVDKLAGYIDFLGDKSTTTADKIWSLAAVIGKLNPGGLATTVVDAVFGDDAPEKADVLKGKISDLTGDLDGVAKATNKAAEATKHFTIASKQSASKTGKTGNKSAAKQADDAATALIRQTQTLARLSTGYAEGSLELAKYDAVLALGNKASTEQIAKAEQQAESIWKIQQATKAAAEEERKRKEAGKNYSQIKSSVSPVASLDNSFQSQMQQLNEYAALYPQKIAEVEATRATIEAQYRQQRIEAMWQEWSQQTLATQAASAAFTALGNNASNVLTGILTGSMSASDALRSIGSTVLNSVINTFVQMGVEWAKSAILGATTQQAAITATTAAQVAGITTQTAASTAAAATTTAAWTPAALMSSIASWGAAVAIGVGAMAGVMALAGKRKNGGPVSAGGMYQVGEGGMPEIYQASTGRQYMIPGDNGKVISNKDMQGAGGGAPVLNIYNYSSASVDAQATQNGDGSWTLEAFIADMNNGGPASSAITSNMNVKRTPRGQG